MASWQPQNNPGMHCLQKCQKGSIYTLAHIFVFSHMSRWWEVSRQEHTGGLEIYREHLGPMGNGGFAPEGGFDSILSLLQAEVIWIKRPAHQYPCHVKLMLSCADTRPKSEYEGTSMICCKLHCLRTLLHESMTEARGGLF